MKTIVKILLWLILAITVGVVWDTYFTKVEPQPGWGMPDISEVYALANSSIIINKGVICCGNKIELKAVNKHILVGHCSICGKSIAVQL